MNKESQNLEWKESWRDEYLKWICGFANAQGGKIVIGIDDQGRVIGVNEPDKLLQDIPNKVKDILGIVVAVNLKKKSGKNCIEIKVDAQPYPVSFRGQYFHRTGSIKHELKGGALDRFLLLKQGKRWDAIPVPDVGVSQLDQKAFALFRKKAAQSKRLTSGILKESGAQLLEKLKLVEGKRLKRAAVLLFHVDPEKYITGAFIKIGFFKNNADLLYHNTVHGNLFEQVEKTMDLLLTKYSKASINYEGITRVEKHPFPDKAMREVILNAVIHKDYSSGIPVQISIYENKIVVWNDGQLPDNWTVDKLIGKHPSVPYNPDVAAAFFRAGYIESWGRGIATITEACKSAGMPMPVFTTEFNGLMVVFEYAGTPEKMSGKISAKMSGKISGKMSGKTSLKTPEKTPAKMSGKTSPKMSGKIIALIRENPRITIPALSKLLQVSERSIERGIQKLQTEKCLRRVGAAKGGHWEILE